LDDLNAACEAIEQDKEVRVVIITGEGRAFSAGADLKALKGSSETESTNDEFLRFWHKVFNRFEDLPVCTIAAINGFALAGGLELVMVCDLAILSEEAQIGDQHANFGLVAGGGNTQRLPRAIGIRKAKEIMYTGDWISPQDALNFGLVNKVVPADKLEEETMALARKLCEKSPVATATVKRLINKGMQVDLHSGLEMELSGVFMHFISDDCKEGLAAFNEKRQPQFKGR
jgi:enoyl-CoA hydratase/carnithine racemase